MSTPDVPIRMEFTVELAAAPEDVWHAIATANGHSAWFVPIDLEERVGGTVVFHMGEDSSEGSILEWEPPRRIVYEEPDWARLSGHEGAEVTPLVTEYLVEAKAGGTCVVRVVSSAFGTGADWEQESITEMEKSWMPFFEHLRLYLSRFPGQRVTMLEADARVPGTPVAAQGALRRRVGAESIGSAVEVRGLHGEVVRADEQQLLVNLTEPIPGYLAIFARPMSDDEVAVWLGGYFFSDDAAAYVERERANWIEWLGQLTVNAG
jgi:uncharacterized protein YndB with AHSA1/START domain